MLNDIAAVAMIFVDTLMSMAGFSFRPYRRERIKTHLHQQPSSEGIGIVGPRM